MELKPTTIRELQDILKADYGVVLSHSDANEMGVSLLRITRVALSALDRAQKNNEVSSVPQASEPNCIFKEFDQE